LCSVFVLLQKVDLITAQIILLIIIFSFYMLGQVSGMFYSLMNLIPVLLFQILEYDNNYEIGIKPMIIGQSTLIIAGCANFILIIFMHSHFYTAFVRSMRQ